MQRSRSLLGPVLALSLCSKAVCPVSFIFRALVRMVAESCGEGEHGVSPSSHPFHSTRCTPSHSCALPHRIPHKHTCTQMLPSSFPLPARNSGIMCLCAYIVHVVSYRSACCLCACIVCVVSIRSASLHACLQLANVSATRARVRAHTQSPGDRAHLDDYTIFFSRALVSSRRRTSPLLLPLTRQGERSVLLYPSGGSCKRAVV